MDQADLCPQIIYLKNKRNRRIVRWYLMTYPQSSKGLSEGLKREVERRKTSGEKPLEFFAPTFVEAVESGGKLVNSEKLLLFNYFFVHASEEEIYRMKQFEPQYNFFKKRYDEEGVGTFPFVSETTIKSLRCIAAAYCGKLPVYVAASPWLIKGDRVKVTRGQFKGLEATLFENQHSGSQEIMVSLDKIAWVPTLKLKPGDYQLLELYEKGVTACELLNDKQLNDLHSALLRHLSSLRGEAISLNPDRPCERSEMVSEDLKPLNVVESSNGGACANSLGIVVDNKDAVSGWQSDCGNLGNEKDKELAEKTIKQFESIAPNSDTKRAKMFSALLYSYRILEDNEQLTELVGQIKKMLPAVKAEQPRALLLLSLYATTANEVYRTQFLELTAPWTRDGLSPKKNHRLLLDKFAEIEQVIK